MNVRFATRIFGVMLLGTTSLGALLGQQTAIPSDRPSEALKAFLRSYLSPGRIQPDATTRIKVVAVKEDGGPAEEQVVYVSGQRWCGSGGCTLLIVESSGSSFNVLGRVTIVELPVSLLPSMKNGHPDIGVRVRGGGIQTGYEAVLSFDGSTYPSNPSLPPAQKATVSRGKEIINTADDSVPLYD